MEGNLLIPCELMATPPVQNPGKVTLLFFRRFVIAGGREGGRERKSPDNQQPQLRLRGRTRPLLFPFYRSLIHLPVGKGKGKDLASSSSRLAFWLALLAVPLFSERETQEMLGTRGERGRTIKTRSFSPSIPLASVPPQPLALATRPAQLSPPPSQLTPSPPPSPPVNSYSSKLTNGQGKGGERERRGTRNNEGGGGGRDETRKGQKPKRTRFFPFLFLRHSLWDSLSSCLLVPTDVFEIF